jgi:hypothetical protein
MSLVFRNFLAAGRKRNLGRFGLFRGSDDLSWIDNQPDPLQWATVTFSATPIFDAALGQVLTLTLSGAVTSSSLTSGGGNPTQGTQIYLRLLQDSTGGRTFAFPANLKVDNNYAIDSRANSCTILPIEWNGTAWEFFSAPFSFLNT